MMMVGEILHSLRFSDQRERGFSVAPRQKQTTDSLFVYGHVFIAKTSDTPCIERKMPLGPRIH